MSSHVVVLKSLYLIVTNLLLTAIVYVTDTVMSMEELLVKVLVMFTFVFICIFCS